MPGKLSTHVLDTYSGCPASGIAWELSYCDEDGAWLPLGAGVTNHQGRTDAPLLAGDVLVTGCYRLSFSVGNYYQSLGVALPDPAFLDVVILQVNLIAGQDYHVPLLVSPWSYSTYRGS